MDTVALPQKYKSPLYILWDLTYSCNHKCIFCYNNCNNQVAKSLSTEQLGMIAEQILENEIVSVAFGGGEPLLQQDTVFHLGNILRGNVWLTLITNGSLITPELVKPLSETFSAIQISLHGIGDGFDKIAGFPGAYENVIRGIELLGSIGYRQIEICFVLTRHNQHFFEPLVERLIFMGNVPRIRVQNLIPTGMGYINRNSLYLTPIEVNGIIKRYRDFIESKHNKIAFLYDDVVDELITYRKGNTPNPFFHIYPDGNVGIFPHIPVIIGNLLKESLHSIWDNIGANFFQSSETTKMLEPINNNNDIGWYTSLNNRPWIDKPIYKL